MPEPEVSTATAPLVLREPFRLLFPLAVVLGGIGVGHWLLYALGLQGTYSCQGHGLVQTQAFLVAFAAGFLMTMVPRRTGVPATWLEVGLVAAALVVTTLAALEGAWVACEIAFLVAATTLAFFVLRRVLRMEAPGRPTLPHGFVLVGVALVHAAVGAGLVLAGDLGRSPHATTVGRWMLQEGVFLCMVLGVGHLVMPLLRGAPITIAAAPPRESWWRGRAAHALAGALVLASFPLQWLVAGRFGAHAGTRAGCLVRGATFALDAAACLRAGWPAASGLHRRVAWIAFWMVPFGELLAGLLPAHRVPMLHVTFIGGFSLLSFAVAFHVVASHSGATELVFGRPWQVWTFGGLFLLAMGTRVTADFLPSDGYWVHVGAAAGIWLLALAAWLSAALSSSRRRQRSPPLDLPPSRG